jgi:hypothetical protein
MMRAAALHDHHEESPARPRPRAPQTQPYHGTHVNRTDTRPRDVIAARDKQPSQQALLSLCHIVTPAKKRAIL